MPPKTFPGESDTKKHFVRLTLWLPFCQQRASSLQAKTPQAPLRYLTFCAEDAIDVLLLENKGILATHGNSYPDVAFAAFRPAKVTETLRTIPGARGYPGDFFENVLFDPTEPPDHPAKVLTSEQDDSFFAALATAEQDRAGRARVTNADLTRQLQGEFPFDIINLDLCGSTFSFKENVPGRIIKALRRILSWQRLQPRGRGEGQGVREFTLLYTTRIDVSEPLAPDFERMLDAVLDSNAATYSDVGAAFRARTGVTTAAAARGGDKADYLRLATTKLLISTVAAEGWEIQADPGVSAYEIPRIDPRRRNRYGMLHLAMHLRRVEALGRTRAPRVPRGPDSQYHRTVKGAMVSRPSGIPHAVPDLVKDDLAGLVTVGQANRAQTSNSKP